MRFLNRSIWPLSMATTVAITSTGWADTAPISPQMSQPLVAASLASAPAEAANYRSWTVVAGGTYALHIPANSGIVLSIDGKQVAAATGARLADAGEMITALLTLEAGDHVVTITGVSAENAAIGAITVNLVGSPAQPLIAVSTALDAGAVAELQAASVVPANSAKAGEIQSAATSGASPFAIGGGSSRSEIPSSAANASNPALMRTASAPAAVAAASRVPAPTSGTSILSGGIRRPQTPSTPASGGGSGASDRMPSASGGTGGRRLTGHGGPRSDRQPLNPSGPVIPPALDTIQTSPLSPPKNVTLTQAIELTWAGNSAGQVANTGTTLFGGVMDPMQYDLINVTIAPGGRTTTVDVGAVTGQFAVRLFPEDFAAGAVVTVSLVGGSSVDANVASMPVSYTVTGVAPVDGITQAMSRLTFGPSPELYARMRGIGYTAFVEEQLNPDTIPDGRFSMMNPGGLLARSSTDRGTILNSIIAHDTAYAGFSQKQLREVMSQFWANHFYAANKDSSIYQQAIDDRNFYRANALGNFEDMLLYSARSPLMSQYLDNDQNRVGNINENYGREILELSTVGVEADYTDEDIISSSKIFTGWGYEWLNESTPDQPRRYAFKFRPERHDSSGPKVFAGLGISIEGRSGEAGVQEGEEFIALLAQHPNTRNFVCGKIVTLLVADTPPAQFVQSCAAAWEASGGEVKEMLRAILLDPAYIQNVELQRNKAKTPMEMAFSTIRAFGAAPRSGDEQNFYSLFRQPIQQGGYNYVSDSVNPTGLPEVAGAWLNSATTMEVGNRLADVAERRDQLGIDLVADGIDAGLETAEEFAAYLLTVATADRFTREEYESLVAELKGNDGIFDPRNSDERRALERAMGLVLVMPSFAIQ